MTVSFAHTVHLIASVQSVGFWSLDNSKFRDARSTQSMQSAAASLVLMQFPPRVVHKLSHEQACRHPEAVQPNVLVESKLID